MNFLVEITEGALADLYSIQDYYLMRVSDVVASRLIEQLDTVLLSLAEQPHRGVLPQELSGTEYGSYRQIVSHPFRVIYEAVNDAVFVYMVIDSRRDVRLVLQRRLNL